MDRAKECLRKARDPLCMILIQIFAMGMVFLSKLALNEGMFIFSFLCYRSMVAALFLAPFALYYEWELRNKLSWSVVMWIFISALLVIPLAMGSFYYGLKATTATYSTNFLNLVPVATFVLAVILRMEKLALRTRGGKMKIFGTLLCVGGAMVVSLYKGKAFHIWPSLFAKKVVVAQTTIKHDWLRGTVFLVCYCFCNASWFVVQAKLLQIFPSKYWAAMSTCLAGCLQSAIVGVLLNKEKAAWRLKWSLQLLTIVYSGILNTGVTFCLISWVISRRGPIYPTIFSPLSQIFVMLVESLFAGQEITIGSLLGMCLIIGGLYAFIWGKVQETVQQAQTQNSAIINESSQDELNSSAALSSP